MGRPMKDLTGARFGRLVVVGFVGRDKTGNHLWSCVCDCGNTSVPRSSALTSRRAQSCGCLRLERFKAAVRITNTKHGRSKQQLYRVWSSMKDRCNRSDAPSYPNYGGRGIEVCQRWAGPDGFLKFVADVGERPANPPGWTGKKAYWTIERIDNDGNYEPDNVRWASTSEQQMNRRPNAFPPKPRKRPTHCKYGHAMDAANTYTKPNGARVCKTCRKKWQ